MVRWFLFCFLIGFSVILCGPASAEAFSLTASATLNGQTTLSTTEVNGEKYLFLPSCVTPDAVQLYTDVQGTLRITGEAGRSAAFVSGESVDIAALFAKAPEDGRYPVTISAESGANCTLTMMFSEGIASVYLISNDPQNTGRAYIDGSWRHETTANGRFVMLRADGGVLYNGGLNKIRGRGNTTWGNYPLTATTYTTVDKKPYQVKLSQKADLMDTGDPAEASKTWVLLAEYYDGTLLRNHFSFALARELGQSDAPNSQLVDLYYDGEYRGLYLLAEKVEVGQGRVDITDYDDILKAINQYIGVDVKEQPQEKGVNLYGMEIAGTANVEDAGETNLGGYLVELDNAYFAQERAWFTLRCGAAYTVRNPQYASLAMVSAISELFEEIDGALQNYGLNPDTGLSWESYLDADTVLPYLWTNLLAQNPDTWLTSSTYFVLPEGGGKLRMSQVWDFDVAYTSRGNGESVTDLFSRKGSASNWALDLLCIPTFQTMAKNFFTESVLPAVDILLGDTDAKGIHLHSLAWYWQTTAASRRMNDVLWDPAAFLHREVSASYDENYASLRVFIAQRRDYLASEVESWPESEPQDVIQLTLEAPYANVEYRIAVTVDDLHENVRQPAVTLTLETEATQEAYATWRADIRITPKPGVPFAEDMRVLVNGVAVNVTTNEEDEVTASVWFEDPSYRPAVFEDTDYGLVFDADYYRAHYPEVVAQAGEDAQALLSWYVENGIGQGQQANAFFNPAEALAGVPDIGALYGDNAEGMIWYFLESGYEDLMSTLDCLFWPDVRAVQ